MYEFAVILKWLSGLIALIAILSVMYYGIRLSILIKQGDDIGTTRANNEVRDNFGLLLPCALLVYWLSDLIIVIMRNTG